MVGGGLGANPNFVAEPHGWTPLHVSAAYNKKDGTIRTMHPP